VATDELNLPRVQPRVLRQEVLEALRSAILANRIAPGSRLLEADIATRMGVSRAPVREAIRQLEQEGLVEFFPHRGAVVIGLPEDEIDAIYELRALIEERAIERACDAATEADIARLEGLIADMRAALKQHDVDELAEIDLRFHGAIVELSGFSLLRHFWQSLDGLVRVRSYQALDRPGRAAQYFLSGSIASHAVLVDAIRARDRQAASAAVRAHILDVAHQLHAEGAAPAGTKSATNGASPAG
jgi:DNA-binding GntR family transcriptional regulator